MGNLSGMEEMNNNCDKRVHMGKIDRGFIGLDGWKSYEWKGWITEYDSI
jgi:hypothetical protein